MTKTKHTCTTEGRDYYHTKIYIKTNLSYLKCPSCGDTTNTEKTKPIHLWSARNLEQPVRFYKCDKCNRIWNTGPLNSD